MTPSPLRFRRVRLPALPASTHGGLALAGLLVAAVAGPLAAQDAGRAGAPDDLVVDAAWLQAHLDDPRVVVLHVGRSYAEGHVPGAVALDLAAITAPAGEGDGPPPLRLELPSDLEVARAAFEAAGVGDASTVVAVFEEGRPADATRAIWTLQVLGKDDARLLDGGLAAWVAAGGALSTEASTPAPGRLTTAPRLDLRVDRDFVLERGGSPGIALVDARRPVSYTGEREEMEGRAGHIPGAGSLHTMHLFDDAGLLRPRDELRDLFAEAGVGEGDRVVAYCHIGLWASGVVFVARTLGYEALLYDGSMNEWAADPELPLEPGGR